jgi:hypothetical protein
MDQAITPTAVEASPVVELRQYTLKPGRRDELITMFEKHFVAPQVAEGLRIDGPFRVPDRPERFVWLRGFASLEDRPRALGAFYGGPAWQAHRNAANATMEDSDDVLLLQPAEAGQGFSLARRMGAVMVATIYLLQAPVDANFLRFFNERVAPVMRETGAPPVAALKSLEVANNFPRLPIREGEHAFVWFAAFDNQAQLREHIARLDGLKAWKPVEAALAGKLVKPAVSEVLLPTQRALDRSRAPYRYSLELTGHLHDFDFIDGSWSVVSQRLKRRGVGSDEWEAFPAESWAKVLLNGVANVDEIHFPTKGWSGMTMRHFDVAKRQWSIHWVNSRDGLMQSPVHGGFDGDTGLFYGDDVDEGRAVRVVYRWTRQDAAHARWEQAFSYDDGRTWETNWVMELTRRP